MRKFRPPIKSAKIFEQLEMLEQSYAVFPLTAAVVLEAVRGTKTHRLSYYDAQIWATATLYQVPCVLSEDVNSGGVIEGVAFVNPFRSKTRIETL